MNYSVSPINNIKYELGWGTEIEEFTPCAFYCDALALRLKFGLWPLPSFQLFILQDRQQRRRMENRYSVPLIRTRRLNLAADDVDQHYGRY